MLDRWNDTLEGLLCRIKEFELCLANEDSPKAFQLDNKI